MIGPIVCIGAALLILALWAFLSRFVDDREEGYDGPSVDIDVG